jgi:hypothetical protein
MGPTLTKIHRALSAKNTNKEWRRFKVAFGIPGVAIGLGMLFSQSFIGVLISRLSLTGDIIWLSIVASITLYVLVSYRRSFTAAGRQIKLRVIDGSTDRLGSKRALIAVMGLESGRASSPLALLLSQLSQLDYLVLLGTPETKALGVASQITHDLLGASGFTLASDQIEIFEQGDSYSMEDFDLATRQAVNWLIHKGVTTSEIVCDITAGKRAMGFGVMLAADHIGVEVQYRDSNWDREAKSRVPGRLVWKTLPVTDSQHVEV